MLLGVLALAIRNCLICLLTTRLIAHAAQMFLAHVTKQALLSMTAAVTGRLVRRPRQSTFLALGQVGARAVFRRRRQEL